VALAAVLGAGGCEIYTDVDGVYTTDPRVVPEARKIDRITYDEMLELASLGAGVMHSRSIEFAKKYGVPIHVRSSFADADGTWIVDERDAQRLGVAVTGAALAKDEARITIRGVPDRPGVVHAIFRRIAAANIVVDMIVQNVSTGGTTEVSFTVAKGDLAETLNAADIAARDIGATGVSHDAEVAKISVVGLGMRTHTGVATAMFEALASAGINIQMITTSEIKISVLVDRQSATAALRTVHRAFTLDLFPNLASVSPARAAVRPQGRAMRLVPLADADVDLSTLTAAAGADSDHGLARPPGMEDLVIDGIELDESQARIALFHLPDRPGFAARIFRAIAQAGVFVDMIVQNVAIEGDSLLSFTVPRDAADEAALALEEAGVVDVSVERSLAKLSVVGVGMRTHTGAATRMFAALAERGININLINTSEVRINVGTDIERGREGLECLKRAFAL
jgi:aspartate kinase